MKKMFKILTALFLIATLSSCTSPRNDEIVTPLTTPTYNIGNNVPVIVTGSEGVEYITTTPA